MNCKHCNKSIEIVTGHRKRRYCDDNCKMKWVRAIVTGAIVTKDVTIGSESVTIDPIVTKPIVTEAIVTKDVTIGSESVTIDPIVTKKKAIVTEKSDIYEKNGFWMYKPTGNYAKDFVNSMQCDRKNAPLKDSASYVGVTYKSAGSTN